MAQENIKDVNAWVVCRMCKDKHRLIPAIETPIYWCGGVMYKLEEGDDIEYEGIKE